MKNKLLPELMLAASCCVATMAFAQGPDELWEITNKMEMAGMSMPARTDKVCKPKGDRDPSKMGEKDKNSDCKMVDSKQSGNRSTWKIVCTKPDPMTGTGDVTYTGDKFDGTIKMTGKMDGDDFSMTQVLSGKKVGSCKYEDPGKKAEQMQAQSQAMIDKECDKQIEELQPGSIFGAEGLPESSQFCKHRKADFCAKAKKVSQSMGDEAGFEQASRKHRNWREAMQACGTDPNTVSAPVCKAAVDKKNLKFVADNCPVEGKALAQKQCAGMDYTAIMASEYREVCQKYASELGKAKVGTGKTETAPAPAAPKSDKDKAMDAVKEGGNKLKKLLKF
ncbi:MAG TPA: DUF3617 family protein [Burkholderiales bacterium]